MKLQRVFVAYDKETGDMVHEYEINDIELSELQTLFGEVVDDPMVHTYVVTELQKDRLEEAAGATVDLKAYDYYIDTYAIEDE